MEYGIVLASMNILLGIVAVALWLTFTELRKIRKHLEGRGKPRNEAGDDQNHPK